MSAQAATKTGKKGQTLHVNRTAQLNPAGDTVDITGENHDLEVGLYLAFCVNNGVGKKPTPCLGGMDTSGKNNSSIWISSNKSYGDLVKPMTEKTGKGFFNHKLFVKAQDGEINCLNKTSTPNGCAIVVRADHMHGWEEAYDVIIPVSFNSPANNEIKEVPQNFHSSSKAENQTLQNENNTIIENENQTSPKNSTETSKEHLPKIEDEQQTSEEKENEENLKEENVSEEKQETIKTTNNTVDNKSLAKNLLLGTIMISLLLGISVFIWKRKHSPKKISMS